MKVECRQNWRLESTEECKCISIYVLPLCNVVPRPFITKKRIQGPDTNHTSCIFLSYCLFQLPIVCFSPPPFSHSAPLTPVPGSPSKHLFFCSLPKTGKHDFIHNPPTLGSVKSLVMKRCGHLRPIGLSCIRLAHTKMLRCCLCGLCVSSTASG